MADLTSAGTGAGGLGTSGARWAVTAVWGLGMLSDVLSGSVAEVPARLLAQLSDRGRLLAITGQEPVMRVTLVRRKGDRFEVSYPWDVNAARLQHFEEPSTFQF